MNQKEKEHFIEWVKKDVAESIESTLENLMLPSIADKPYVSLHSGEETGLYVDATDCGDPEGKYARVIPWDEFVEDIGNYDLDVIERYYPLFQALVTKMEKHIQSCKE